MNRSISTIVLSAAFLGNVATAQDYPQLAVYMNWSRIADANCDSRRVTARLIDQYGFEMSGFQDLSNQCGQPDAGTGVWFPLFYPDTEFMLEVTVSEGLVGGGVEYFNSSDLLFDDWGVAWIYFDILSTGFNYTADGQLPPNYIPPSNCGIGNVAWTTLTLAEQYQFYNWALNSAVAIYERTYPDKPLGQGWLGNWTNWGEECQVVHNRIENIMRNLMEQRVKFQRLILPDLNVCSVYAYGYTLTPATGHIYFGIIYNNNPQQLLYFADPWRKWEYYGWRAAAEDPNVDIQWIIPSSWHRGFPPHD